MKCWQCAGGIFHAKRLPCLWQSGLWSSDGQLVVFCAPPALARVKGFWIDVSSWGQLQDATIGTGAMRRLQPCRPVRLCERLLQAVQHAICLKQGMAWLGTELLLLRQVPASAGWLHHCMISDY